MLYHIHNVSKSMQAHKCKLAFLMIKLAKMCLQENKCLCKGACELAHVHTHTQIHKHKSRLILCVSAIWVIYALNTAVFWVGSRGIHSHMSQFFPFFLPLSLSLTHTHTISLLEAYPFTQTIVDSCTHTHTHAQTLFSA